MAAPFIIGASSTRFGELWEYGLRDLIREASIKAVKSADLELKDVDSLFVANCFSGIISDQNSISALCSDELGIKNSVHIGGDNGSFAVLQAANSIMAGKSKIALVIGVEKITDVPTKDIAKISSALMSHEESLSGLTLAGAYAMMTLRYSKQYSITEEQINKAAIKAHSNAVENEIAQFRNLITNKDILSSPFAAEPIRMLNSSSFCDGCSVVVMCNDEVAENCKNKIKLIGSGVSSDFLSLHEREDITQFNAVKEASKTAFAKAGLSQRDISFAEVNDIFSISEIMAIEALGFAEKGEGAKFIEKGNEDLDGEIPINPSGGLKGCGHPFAATGIRQVMECFLQINNMAGRRQVKNPRYALAENHSATCANAVVSIFSRE